MMQVTLEKALMVLFWIVLVFAGGFLAEWIVRTFFPEEIRKPAYLIVGVVLLILIAILIIRVPGFSP